MAELLIKDAAKVECNSNNTVLYIGMHGDCVYIEVANEKTKLTVRDGVLVDEKDISAIIAMLEHFRYEIQEAKESK